MHHDDFPNVYFTIAPLSLLPGGGVPGVSFTEKQTDAKRLRALDRADTAPRPPNNNSSNSDSSISQQEELNPAPVSALPPPSPLQQLPIEGTSLSLTITFGKLNLSGVEIGTGNTVLELRERVGALVGLLPKQVKLLCRGSVLKVDAALIGSTKVVDGSKIMVMNS